MNKLRSSLVIVGLASILIGLAWRANVESDDSRSAVEPLVEPTPPILEPARADVEPTEARAGQPEPETARSAPASAEREASDRMRAEIQRSLARRASSPESGSSAPVGPRQDRPIEASELSEHNRAYLRDRVQKDLLPPVLDCYTAALKIDPTLGGKLALQFAVIGDPEIGGVVEYAEILEAESTLISPFMSECVRESTLAMTFDAPPEGGRFELHYPLEFEPDEGE